MCCPRVSFDCNTTGKVCKLKFPLCILHQYVNKKESLKVDSVTAPSKITLNTVINNGFFTKARKTVIANAIRFDRQHLQSLIDMRASRGVCNRNINFVFLGTLSEKKGILWLLDAFEHLNNDKAILWIAGKGELSKLVESKSLSNSRIRFVGFLNEGEVDELLSKMDVLIAPSLWEEPFGRVVLDAYAHAMPVIVSDCGALPTLVNDKKTGIIVPHNDTNGLIETLEYYIQNPDEILKQGNNSAYELESYTIEHQVDFFVNEYKELLEF